MTPKPNSFPIWAADDYTDPTSGINNVVAAPSEFQQYGYANEFDPMIRQYENWKGRLTSQWLQYFAQQIGSVVTTDGNGVGLLPAGGYGMFLLIAGVPTYQPNAGGLNYVYNSSFPNTVPNGPSPTQQNGMHLWALGYTNGVAMYQLQVVSNNNLYINFSNSVMTNIPLIAISGSGSSATQLPAGDIVTTVYFYSGGFN
jgi:hypothetical protein